MVEPRVVVVLGEDGRIAAWSPEAARLFGYSASEVIGRGVSLLAAGSDGNEGAIAAEIARAFTEGRAETETELRRKDGSVFQAHAVSLPVEAGGGSRQVVRILSEHSGPASSRESEVLFRTLGEAVPVLLWMSDAHGAPVYQNPAFREYTGANGADLEGNGWEKLVHPEDLARARELWREAVARAEPFQLEYRCRRRDGAYRWFVTRNAPVKDATGRVARWVGTLTDVDESKRALDALRQADQHKEAFLAMLGHELRNPLGPIRNAAQIVGMVGAAEPTVSRALEIIDRQVGHMSRLIDDLLDVSKIVAGKLELHRERADLTEVVRQTVEAYRPSLETAGLRFVTELASQPLVVDGDRTRLAQVVGNLLHNARKFTPPGGTVTVRLAQRPDGRRAVLTVADTGIGMDPELLQRAFEVFSQADRSLERAGGGLGLGLALVKGLVDLHGGDVRAASPGPRKGAQVTVELPIAPGIAAAERGPGAAAGATRLRVLVIEDNVDAAESLQTLLRLAGHDVQTALSGTSGVAVAERYRPDVVLCDIGLPGMDGYEVARTLRKAPTTSRVHLVALTGYGQDEDRKRGREAGFDDYLTKPADFGMLQNVMLRQRRTA